MVIKTVNLFSVVIVMLSLLGCGSSHYSRGVYYQNSGQNKKAIEEYKKGLSSTNNELLFSLYNNIGVSYGLLGKKEKAKDSFLKSAEQWPARAYYSYFGLADLARKQGNLLEAIEYIKKATVLVKNDEYKKIEKGMSGYSVDMMKIKVIAENDYLQLLLEFEKLNKQFDRKKYQDAKRLAGHIIKKKYLVSLGIVISGYTVHEVIQGSVADLNGMLVGDKILEIDGVRTTDSISLRNAESNLSERFDEKINIKVRRKNRTITIVCHLYYPELETTRRILNEVNSILSAGKFKHNVQESEPPQVLVLKPDSNLGIRVVNRKNIELVVLAGDNSQVSEVSVNGVIFTSSEASSLEKTLLKGEVKKYTATVSLVGDETTYLIEATDISGNKTTKSVRVIYNPDLDRPQENIYRHRIAVVIGIDKYQTWPSLEFAVSDAKSIKEKLYHLGFNKVIELYDSEATRLQILRLLSDQLPSLLDENDSLMIFFAGHGHTETFEYQDKHKGSIKEKEGYIVPVDADTKNFQGTAISMSKIREMSKQYKSKHILFVFDSCYSGLGLKRSGGITKADGYIKKLSSMKVVQIITAGGENETVGEEKGHGIFTRYLLLALEGRADLNTDGFITASEIGTYIRPIVSRKTNNTQTPKFGWILGEGDFIFENRDVEYKITN